MIDHVIRRLRPAARSFVCVLGNVVLSGEGGEGGFTSRAGYLGPDQAEQALLKTYGCIHMDIN